MRTEGRCACAAVRFSVEADSPVPYLRCCCSVCRRTAGSGGYAINLGARADTLAVTGRRFVRHFQVRLADGSESPARRYFCRRCGSALWVADARWPDLVHPFAGAVDTPLPAPRGHVHMMLGSKADWVPVEGRAGDAHVDRYPTQSLAEWHRAHGF